MLEKCAPRAAALAALFLLSASSAAWSENDAPRTMRAPADLAMPATSKSTKCTPTISKMVTETTAFDTTSSSYVTVRGSSKSIRVGGRKPSCVIVTLSFEGLARPDGIGNMAVRAHIAGVGGPHPPSYFVTGRFASNSSFYRLYTAQFLFPNVRPGRHTVEMQVAEIGGGEATEGNRAMRIEYAR